MMNYTYIKVVVCETARGWHTFMSADIHATRAYDGDVLFGVLGSLHVAPLCRMWYATNPDLSTR